MDRVIYTAMSGAKSTLDRQAAVSNNLANANSTGFRAELHRLRAVDVKSDALPTRAFVIDASAATDFSAGPLQFTGRSLDAAIEGKGWFSVAQPGGGEAYTRDGGFEVSANGVLQTRAGLPVLGEQGMITIPPEAEITIGRDGSLSVVENGINEIINVIDRLKLVNPPEQQLERGEDGLFRLADGVLAPLDETVQVAGGFIEGSNVSVVDQLVEMIATARQFEMQTRMLQSAEENDNAAAQILSMR